MPEERKPNRVDLDVVADIRKELGGSDEENPPEIVFKGERFVLPPDLPLDAIEVQGEIGDLLAQIEEVEREQGQDAANRVASRLGRLYIRLGAAMLEDEWDRFRSGDYGPKATRRVKPGLGILAELAASAAVLYPALPEELESGEGQASGVSSNRASRRSRPSGRKPIRRK